MATRKVVLCCSLFVLVQSGYPPIGDEVVPGSVLLPATRRGRYLANIVRRQAVDGTGIRFNKDADRINAEAKKKVDVLSEELLPYIIAEQERRAALHARVMSAVQNGEKGATVAEMRGKPPLLIRKGLMYRCPSNRAPKEPDGSGVIMCEGDIEPTPVMYDSCLSAEDKDLYVAENKYFFCNRHKVEGPDLPRNGSAVIGCAPIERTSLNYTATKCALEDTDDVVVHYRYYPDRTYKFVTELDPDHEVCDHWNPCQLGYIFSLPSPDQALPANELWRFEEYERDEIVPPIAEDTPIEHVPLSLLQEGDSEYEVAPRYVKVPQGYKFDSVWRSKNPYSSSGGFNGQVNQKVPPSQVTTQLVDNGQAIIITLKIKPFRPRSFGPYYAVFVGDTRRDGKRQDKSVLFVELERTEISIEPKSMTVMPGAQQEPENLEYRCKKCRVAGIMVRTDEGAVQNLNPSRWRTLPDSDGHLQVDVSNARPNDFGFYMVRFYADSGEEHLIQALKMLMPGKDSMLHAKVLRMTSNVGDKVEGAITYVCTECDLTDVMCNGESSVSQGKVAIVTGAKTVSFNIASFTDNDACVYMGIYKKEENNYTKILAIFENADVTVEAGDIKASPPKEGEEFQHSIHLKGDEGECTVPTKVSVNGIELDSGPTRRTSHSPIAYFQEVAGMGITISIEPFTSSYNGVYMGTFVCNGSKITKIVMELNSPDSDQDSASETRRMSGTGTVQPTEHILGVSSNGNVPSGQTTPAA